ncbi:MAG TPA: recombinase family protein [Desulfosporosinus sp.]|nr:recombinase family protein [Desulfosporosinus sp.]
MKKNLRCLIYGRISTQSQDYDNQLLQLRKFAEKEKSWDIVDEITDIASGGKSSKERQGLNRVFQLAHKKQFDILLFWSLDRLSREGTRATIEYLTRLDEYGIDFYSFSEPFLTNIGFLKDAIISLLACLAKQEKIRISERTKAGLQRTVRVNGTKLGRPKTPKDKIKRAVKLREQGLSYSAIGKEMGITGARAFQLVAKTLS